MDQVALLKQQFDLRKARKILWGSLICKKNKVREKNQMNKYVEKKNQHWNPVDFIASLYFPELLLRKGEHVAKTLE